MAAHVRGDDVNTTLKMAGRSGERLGTGGVAVDAYHRQRAAVTPVQVIHAQSIYTQKCALWLRQSRHAYPPAVLPARFWWSILHFHRLAYLSSAGHKYKGVHLTAGRPPE